MSAAPAAPEQTEHAGSLAASYRDALDHLTNDRAAARLFDRDVSLWPVGAEHHAVIRSRLGWLDAPAWLAERRDELRTFAAGIRAEGYTRVLLLGMGGSSLAPEVLQRTFRAGPGSPTLEVLDTTDPGAIRGALGRGRLERTLIVVSSKSGSTVETRSQYRVLRAAVEGAGLAEPGRNFVAVTDKGSALDALAAAEGFRAVFRNPADIGGRYSALSYFGMLPAALLGLDLDDAVARASRAREGCRAPSPEANSALRLGAFLAGAAKAGRDKLTLLLPGPLRPFGYWVEQLVAESTGKEGRGIIPVEGEPLGPAHHYGDDRVFVFLALEGSPDSDLDRLRSDLEAAGAPCVRIALPDAEELAGEFYRWEVATAFAGALLAIDPFDEPNVQESKDATQRILAALARDGRLPEEPARTTDAGIGIGAAAPVWERLISGLPAHPGLEAIVQRFLALAAPDDYAAVLAYVERTAESESAFALLRRAVRNATHLPVLQGYGPRYLHSSGQLHKGGPASGLFLVVTADTEPARDVPIPGSAYTFGQLQRAQALGDLESLAAHGKPTLRLHLGTDVAEGLRKVNEAVERAVAARVG
jgi:glucose-6-phosphate isomerase